MAEITIIPKAFIMAVILKMAEGEFLSRLPARSPMVTLSETVAKNTMRKNMRK